MGARPVLFRADGGPGIGSGHLMRCMALAQCLAERGTPVGLLTAAPDLAECDRWRSDGATVLRLDAPVGEGEDGAATARAANGLGAAWVVADSYALGSAFEAEIRRAGLGLLMFDDLANRPLTADLVLNQNAGAEERFVSAYPDVGRTLLGPSYALLRRPLRQLARHPEDHLLISFGGADAGNVGLTVTRELARLDWPGRATLVCTANAAGLAEARRLECDRIAVVPGGVIEPLLASVSVAVGAGGSMSLEMAFLGIAMVLLPIADNQQPGALALARAGAALVADNAAHAAYLAAELIRDPRRRATMVNRAQSLVDGRGGERVAACLDNNGTMT